MIEIAVFGRPAPKGSRIAGKTKTGRAYTYPASKYERPWVDEVARVTQIAMRHHPMPERPYAVDLTFRLKRPVNHRLDWPTTHDLDKLARAVIDGLVKGGAMQDDRHVVALTARKVFAPTIHEQGVVAEIQSVAADRALA